MLRRERMNPLRTQSVGSAAAEKSAAAAEKVSAAAEKRTAVAKSGGCGGGESAAGTPRRRAGKSGFLISNAEFIRLTMCFLPKLERYSSNASNNASASEAYKHWRGLRI